MKNLLFVGVLLLAPYGWAAETMRVHFIDVGQGAATFVEFPGGQTMLIDTGGEEQKGGGSVPTFSSTERLKAYLGRFFGPGNAYDHLTQLVLTHPHKDHVRGVPYVLEELAPEKVVYNGQKLDMNDSELENYLQGDNVESWYVLARKALERPGNGTTNDIIDPFGPAQSGGVDPEIRALWGQVEEDKGESGKNWAPSELKNENNHSVVLRIDFGKASMLVTGDLEESDAASKSEATAARPERVKRPGGIERLIATYKDSGLLDVDVYEVGHHGSHNGNSAVFDKLISPKIAVIACGAPCDTGNWTAGDFGHPRLDVLNELEPYVEGTRPAADIMFYARYPKGKKGEFFPPQPHRVTQAIYLTGHDGDIVMTATSDGDWDVVSTLGANKRCEN